MRNQRERGFTLTEVLVATAIFTIIMLAALLMYDRNNRVFTQGVQASEVQQNTRIAFDKVVSEIRVEGFDYNRNGDPSGSDAATGVNYQRQPDEQIEFMGDSAITFRANLNYNSPPDNGRETAYEAAAFPLVTTSNSEIITYALKSNDTTKNNSTIDFYADVAKPRKAFNGTGGENTERHVILAGYDTTNANPPYTLYRITLKDQDLANETANPGQEVAIATNIRSMRFTYYSDQGGNTELAAVNGAGQYDASQTNKLQPERDTRKQIQAIRLQLVGMNEAPDANYSNGIEPAGSALSHYREYALSSLVVPRNVGKRAVKEENLKAPSPPILKTICYGACGVPYLTWQAPTDGNVDFYSIIYDTDPNGTFTNGYPVGNVTASYFPRPLDAGTTYYFRVESSNGYGDAVSVDTVSVKALNTTTPDAPKNLKATSGTNKITLTFDTPSNYSASSPALTCVSPGGGSAASNAITAAGIAPPEAIAYRIYRYQEKSGGTNANFDPAAGEGELIASESNGTQPYVDINGKATFDDSVPACVNFYYRVQAVASGCINAAAKNSPAQTSVAGSAFEPAAGGSAIKASATASGTPQQPQNFKATRSAGCPAPGSLIGPSVKCTVTLTFDKVTQDTNNPSQAIKVDDYVLTRTLIAPATNANANKAATIPVPNGLWDVLQSAGPSATVTDDFSVPLPDGSVAPYPTDSAGVSYQYTYTLKAKSCANTSTAATVTEPSCYLSPAGTVVTSSAKDGDGTYASPFQMSGNDTILFTLANMDNWQYTATTAGSVKFKDAQNGTPAKLAWPVGLGTPGQVYQIDFVGVDKAGCAYTQTVWAVDEGGVCPYNSPPTATPTPTQVTTGSSAGSAWQLKPGDRITWSQSDLASIIGTITDTSTKLVVANVSLSGTSETLSWPTKTYGTTYQLDLILTSTQGCQRQLVLFVTQVCAGYTGGTAIFTSTDTAHTGTGSSSSAAWQLGSGNTIRVTESLMKLVKTTVTDVTSNTVYPQFSTNASSGIANIAWPPNGISTTGNHLYQLDFILVDTSGCSSTTTTRYVTQTCSFNNGASFTTTVTALSTTLRKSGDTAKDGSSSTSAAQMVPLVDQVRITTTATITRAYITYADPSTHNALGVSTQTVTGSSPLTFTNPKISGKNGSTVELQIVLEDANGCKTTTPKYFYVLQTPCVLRPMQSSTDGTVMSFTGSNNQHSSAATINVINLKSSALTVNSITLTLLASLGTEIQGNRTVTHTLTNVKFPSGATVNVASTGGTVTVNVPSSDRTLAASGTMAVVVNFDYYDSVVGNPIQAICVNYDTTTTTPAATNQSCNINFNASGFYASTNNPSSCD